MSQKRITLTCH